MLEELVRKSRSVRRFIEAEPIPEAVLRELVGLMPFIPSTRNRQALRFLISADRERNALIFPCLRFAAQLDWDGPAEGERPTGYIVILGPRSEDTERDEGAAAQTLMLAAAERGWAGCILGSVDRVRLDRELAIPEVWEAKLVLAFGKAGETVVTEPVGAGESLRYWRDEAGVHHVPKIRPEELILGPDV